MRFSRGDTLYTLSKNGKLVYLAWVRDGKYELKLPGVKYNHQFPEKSRIIYGFSGFGDKISQLTLDSFYEEIIRNCINEGEDVYICFNRKEGASNHYVNKRNLSRDSRMDISSDCISLTRPSIKITQKRNLLTD